MSNKGDDSVAVACTIAQTLSSKPARSARNLLAAGSATANSSRENSALRMTKRREPISY